jgi:N-methylhydantoinase A
VKYSPVTLPAVTLSRSDGDSTGHRGAVVHQDGATGGIYDPAGPGVDMSETSPSVRLGVDVGGTFTDVVLLVAGGLTTAKVPTTDDQHEGVLRGVAAACDAAGVDPGAVERFRHATTVAVNAMLEGEGARTALVTTAGFGDAVEIGRQNRPALYDLSAEKPDPLVPAERRHELDERATTAGIERPVDDEDVRDLAGDVGDAESVAVSFLHAYAHHENERRVAALLREELDCPVSASHEVLATFREYERTATTVADAYLRPVVEDYLARLVEGATGRDLPAPRVMQANGAIATADTVRERAVTTLLSGPAAGVVGASLFEDDVGLEGIVTFDMGGTSSDVGLVREGDIERTTEATVGGHPVGIPMVDVETVGAGGGSVAWVDAGGALRVGPQSAGANPGPACYGKGGDEPTVTDASLVLGYLGADATLGGDLDLDPGRAETVMADLASEAGLDGALAAARGVYRVANATMTRAVRGVTVERGHDPRRLALVAFGGAGPMHAALLAEHLKVGTVLVPPATGVLSALGLLAADERHDAVRTHRTALADADPGTLEGIYDELVERVRSDTTDPGAATVDRAVDCRYAGQSFELTVPVESESFDPDAVGERFHAIHERARGYRLDEPVDVVTLRVTATVAGDPPDLAHDPSGDPLIAERDLYFPDGSHRAPVYHRRRIPVDAGVDGPAVVAGGESTVVVPPGWTAHATDDGALLLEVDG